MEKTLPTNDKATENGKLDQSTDPIDVTDEFKQLEQRETPRVQCFGGCSEIIKKKSWLDELNSSSERSGNNISIIASEAATNAVLAKLEFFKGQTLFHVRFDKKPNNRWENSGRDLVELFDENKPGGDRKSRYEKVKEDMRTQGSKVGMVFSEPTVTDNLNYIHVLVDAGDTVEEYIVQYQGTKEDFSNVYASFSKISGNNNSTIDFETPIQFAQDVPLDSFVAIIEDSYVTAENKEQVSEYLHRLNRDMANLSKIDEYQKEARELANYLEQQMLSQGISHAILNLLADDLDAYAKGSESVEDLAIKHSPEASVVDEHRYIQNKTNEIIDIYGEHASVWMKSMQLALDIIDGKHGEFVRVLLSSDSKSDIIRLIPPETRWIQIATKELGISKKEAQLLEKSVRKLHEIFEEQQRVLDFVSSTGVGIGAAFFAIDVMAISHLSQTTVDNNIPSQNVGTIPEFITQSLSPIDLDISDENIAYISQLAKSSELLMETGSLEFITQLTEKEKDLIFSFFLQKPTESNSKDIKKVTPDGIDVDVLVKTIAFIQQIDMLPTDKREAVVIQEKEKTLTEIVFLWGYLVAMVRHKEAEGSHEKISDHIHSLLENISNPDIAKVTDSNEKEHIENFSFAMVVWMLWKLSGYYANLEFVQNVASKKSKNTLMQLIQKKKSEGIIQKEPASFLLLAIIYYLAKIREQDAIQVTGQPQMHKQKKKSTQYTQKPMYYPIQQQAVIFAFGS